MEALADRVAQPHPLRSLHAAFAIDSGAIGADGATVVGGCRFQK
jgi:hypothetical protein